MLPEIYNETYFWLPDCGGNYKIVVDKINELSDNELNLRDSSDKTLLSRAIFLHCEYDENIILHTLLDRLTDEEIFVTYNGGNFNILMEVVIAGNIDICAKLLERIPNNELIIRELNGLSPLYMAIYMCKDIAIMFLETLDDRLLNDSVTALNRHGDTLLHEIVNINKIKLLQYILNRLSYNNRNVRNSKGQTLLDIAREKNHLEFQSLLRPMVKSAHVE